MNITRRKFSLGALSMTLLAAVGCKVVTAIFSPSTLAGLVSEVGSGVVALLTFLGKTALAQQVQADIATAVSAINAWTPGTVATDVENALNDVAAFISTIPGLQAYSALISLAVGTIDYIISLFVQNSPAAPAGAIRPRTVLPVSLPNPPTKSSQFASQWNAKCKALNLETVEIQ